MTIGWYVHHHGAGHLHRFLAARAHLGEDVVGLSSIACPPEIPADRWIELPLDETNGVVDDPTAGGVLHWAPRGVAGLRERTATVARWVCATRPNVLVVDVSVEVALLGRLLSLPTVLIGQRGDRSDGAHASGYASASRIVVPWTPATHRDGGGPPGDQLTFCGAVSRFDDRPPPENPRRAADSKDVLLLVGSGGHDLQAADVVAAAKAAGPERTWHVAGALRVPDQLGLQDHGPDADVWSLLHRCAVVVATAGSNTIAEVAAARRPLVLLPQERPFGEQHAHAAALVRAGLAAAYPSWPVPAEWPGLIAAAEHRDPTRWSMHHDGRGGERLAEAVQEVAGPAGRDADAGDRAGTCA